jgi:SAM-dependent methyltransferase
VQAPDKTSRKSSNLDDNSEQERYFSGLAASHGVNEGSNVDKSEVIFDLLPSPSTHKHILECGGGAGFYTTRFLESGYKVTCVDLSSEALKVNWQSACKIGRESELEVIQGDFTKRVGKMPDNFDAAVFIKVLHHFPDLPSIEDALAAAFRKLRPGGALIIFEPNGRNPLWRPLYLVQKDPIEGKSKWHYEKNLALITESNLLGSLPKGVQGDVQYHYVVPAMLFSGKSVVHNLLARLNKMLELSPLKPWASNISVQVIK